MSGEESGDSEKRATETADNRPKTVSNFRRLLPQVLAATAKNLLLLDLGMSISFPTIVIPALLGGKDPKGLVFDDVQASWFGSALYICQPVGSLLSGIVLEPIGRKLAMIIVNFPHLVAWILLATATGPAALYTAIVLIGLGIGFMEAPIITYIGEISEPGVRGTLTSYSSLFATAGIAFVSLLGSLVDWRTAAAISCSAPILTILAISQVPETPIWLLSRGRKAEAEKALCWLRGWVHPEAVKEELKELEEYWEKARLEKTSVKEGTDNPGFSQDEEVCKGAETVNREDVVERAGRSSLGLEEKVKDFLRPQMLRPLIMILVFFLFANSTGISATRPYTVVLVEKLHFPVEPYTANVIVGVVGFVASVLCMATVSFLGRRLLGIGSMLACALSGLLLGSRLLPQDSWLPFLMFLTIAFSTYYGCGGLVWTMISEVFPFRGRGMASGVCAAASYVMAFAATKSFIWLETGLGLDGLFILSGILSTVGTVYLYFFLPETEGKTLQDIELSYTKKTSS